MLWVFCFLLCISGLKAIAKHSSQNIDYPRLSGELVEMAQGNRIHEFDSIRNLIADAPFDVLKNQLYSDTRKKTFWMNVHNAFVVWLIKTEPGTFKSHTRFLSAKRIKVAGIVFNLNEIEHGILRRSSFRNSETDAIKQLRVLEADYRVHFGINFGAQDCPAIVPFAEHTLSEQLKEQEKQFISQHTILDSVKKEIRICELFEWYNDDFGGKEGLRALLVKTGFNQARDWRINYTPFNWEPLP